MIDQQLNLPANNVCLWLENGHGSMCTVFYVYH